MPKYSSILFYKLFPVTNVTLFRLWQKELCLRLGLKGRIIVSPHGINGTLAGTERDLKAYAKACREWPELGKVTLKWSHGLDAAPFPKLSVKERSELVTFNWDGLAVTSEGVVNSGAHVNAHQLHDLLQTVADTTNKSVEEVIGSEVLFLDGRNSYEYRSGHFKGALDPGVANAKEFEPFIASGAIDEWKTKPVITYCTGGIRCEILTPLLKSYGFEQVYQLDGGIVRYLEQAHNRSDVLWEGSVYTFDTRLKLWDTLGPVIGECVRCLGSTDDHRNCRLCGEQVLVCDRCWSEAERCSNCKEK